MIYVKTELGKTALQDRSLGLSPKQRSVFIMFDGKRSAEEALKATAALGVTADDLMQLVTLGLLAPLNAGHAESVRAVATPQTLVAPSDLQGTAFESDDSAAPVLSDQAHYARAYLVAVKLTGALGLRGFRLNLAVEGAGNLEALKDLAPKIKEAVGVEKFRELENALYR